MKFYKDTKNVYWIDGRTIPSGIYVLDPSEDFSAISIYPYDRDIHNNLPTRYNVPVSEILDINNTPYADYDALYAALSDFFVKATGDSGPFEIITVADNNADYQTVKDALDSITDSSETRRYVIKVNGVTTENNPIQGKPYVTVIGEGDNNTVRIQAGNPNEDLFLGAHLFYIDKVSLYGVIGTGKYAINHSVAGEMLLRSVIFTDCSNGILNGSDSCSMNVLDCAVYTPSASTDKAIYITGGEAIIRTFKNVANSTVTNLIEASGANTNVTIVNTASESPNVTTAFKFTDGVTVKGNGNTINNAYDGQVLSGNNVDVRQDGTKIIGSQNHGFRIDNVGTNIKLGGAGNTVIDSGVLNFVINNPNSLVYGFGFTQITKSQVVPGAQLLAVLLDDTEGDEGTNIFGELHVGSAIRPTEMAVGEGDSYTVGMKVFTESSTGTFTDVTSEAASASGSTFSFADNNVNSSIYFGSSLTDGISYLKHYGIKALLETAADYGTGEIVLEFWNGTSWEEENGYESEADGNYTPNAKNYFTKIGASQIRYNLKMQSKTWTPNDPITPTLGQDYYWVRFRIKSAITASPVFQQTKLHTNRFEINRDGFHEYFGSARPIGQLPVNIGSAKPVAGNMQNEALWVADSVGIGFQQNKFTTTTDILGFNFLLPYATDTSTPIEIIWGGLPNSSAAIEWTLRAYVLTPDGILSTSEPATLPTDITIVSDTTVAGETSTYRVGLDISTAISRREIGVGDLIWISLQPTILSGTFTLAGISATFTKWCEGGHI